jgi:hypothetical protein
MRDECGSKETAPAGGWRRFGARELIWNIVGSSTRLSKASDPIPGSGPRVHQCRGSSFGGPEPLPISISAFHGDWKQQLEAIVGRHVSLEAIVPDTPEDAEVRRSGSLLWARD